MRRYFAVSSVMLILLLWNIPAVSAQFSEAGVQALSVPVDAPDFTLKELGGEVISIKQLRGKVIILNFFTTW